MAKGDEEDRIISNGGGDGGAGGGRYGTELLVVTHEDARFALNSEVALKRPKETAAKRLQRAVMAVQEIVLRNRARRRCVRCKQPQHCYHH